MPRVIQGRDSAATKVTVIVGSYYCHPAPPPPGVADTDVASSGHQKSGLIPI